MQACAFLLVVLLVLVALLTEAVNSLLICTNLSNRILITMRHKYAKFGYFFGFAKRHQKQRWSKPIFNCKMDFNEDGIIIPPNIDSEFLPKYGYRSMQIHSRWEHQQQRRWFLARLLFIRSLFIPQRDESLFFFRQAMDNNLSDISSGSSLIDCLLDDLPARPSNCIRLFLARHGQTESNRLHLVQGSRVDTSLTDTGKKQAQRIGQVLRRQFRNKNACFVHSKWIRSKETAALAALEMVQHSNNDSNSTIVIQKDPVPGSPPSLLLLPSISKIDFGLQEGNSTKDILSEMFQIYNSWSAGFIDVRPVGGGESGREVCVIFKYRAIRYKLMAILRSFNVLTFLNYFLFCLPSSLSSVQGFGKNCKFLSLVCSSYYYQN